jgi:hypothetical protein
MLKATLNLKRDINISKYRAIKLICNRVIHGFESVWFLRLICRDLHVFQAVFIGAWSSSNDIRFRIHG